MSGEEDGLKHLQTLHNYDFSQPSFDRDWTRKRSGIQGKTMCCCLKADPHALTLNSGLGRVRIRAGFRKYWYGHKEDEFI